ncbi:hypothetical protein GCM10010191_44430 [Actinomadura vinacea]|uniref:WXG100 family type VII secretion target n=1 Tax=Actinomadura vinacea TaxID=115336 RepID=A0ABP5WGG3_9ACTN
MTVPGKGREEIWTQGADEQPARSEGIPFGEVKMRFVKLGEGPAQNLGKCFLEAANALRDYQGKLEGYADTLIANWEGKPAQLALDQLRRVYETCSKTADVFLTAARAYTWLGSEILPFYKDLGLTMQDGMLNTSGDNEYAAERLRALHGRVAQAHNLLPQGIDRDLPDPPPQKPAGNTPRHPGGAASPAGTASTPGGGGGFGGGGAGGAGGYPFSPNAPGSTPYLSPAGSQLASAAAGPIGGPGDGPGGFPTYGQPGFGGSQLSSMGDGSSPPGGGFGGGAGGGISSGGNLPGGAPGAMPIGGPGMAGMGGTGGTGPGATGRAGTAGMSGYPMGMGPMGGPPGGQPGQGEQEHTNNYLQAQEDDVFSADDDTSPPLLGG